MKEKCGETEIVASEVDAESNNGLFVESKFHNADYISGFRELQKIAEGASGIVFAALREADGRRVAIKVYKKDLAPNPESIRRFEHEVETLSKLAHSNIVKILGQGTTEAAEPFIVMEIVEGESLRTILDREGALEIRRAITVAREVCRALTAAHEQGIVHRDLKPNNIILDTNNIAKVVDFGVAKAVASSNDTITEYGAVIGTPAYMSPEQCLGERVDARSDVYSLGCTLFEMLTGKKAFESNTAIEALAKQINADRSHVQQVLMEKKLPEDVQQIVRKCLEREPDKRFKSSAELEQELSAYLLDVPLSFSTGLNKLTPLTQIVVCSCLMLVILMVLESNLWGARRSIETAPDAEENRTVFTLSPLQSSSSKALEIRNRMDGKIIYSANRKLTLKEVIQDAADRHISLAYADLKDANLVQSQLTSVDLSHADLTNAKFSQSHLTDINFDNAILTKSQFFHAHLQNVSMRNAMLSACSMMDCKASGVILAGADLSNSNLLGTDLTNANCRYANFTDAKLDVTDFLNADVVGATFPSRQRTFPLHLKTSVKSSEVQP